MHEYVCVYFGVFIYLLCFCFADARQQQRSSDLTTYECVSCVYIYECVCLHADDCLCCSFFVVFIFIAFYLRCFCSFYFGFILHVGASRSIQWEQCGVRSPL